MATRDRSLAEVMRQAVLACRRGEWLSAEGMCRYVLDASPHHPQAQELLAELCFLQGRLNDALEGYERVLARRPHDPGTLYNHGVVQSALGRHEAALASFEAALAQRPRDAAALIFRGNSLAALGRPDEALASYDRALALEPSHPDALAHRGAALAALGRHEQAIQSYERALRLDPRRADAHYNRGNALRALERDAEALAAYDAALALEPGHADAHWNRAWALLALGDYERGLPEYEWRWKSTQWASPPQRSGAPRWLGDSDPAGRTILVLSEQGIGDTLQFVRYVPLLAARGARVVLELPRSLARLCAPYRERAQIVLEDEPVPAHDLQCPMASLPLAMRTALDGVPAGAPYLGADPELAAAWARRLGPRTRSRRVGLVWAGNPRQRSEPRRGVGLAACLPLLGVPGIEWVSLQVGARAADLAELPGHGIADLSAQLTDFAETAAAIANLDLVISSDTAVAHLAGAMGKPVWILLMFAADWRWLRGRADSPWYPSARLFRQSAPGDWEGVIARVQAALSEQPRGVQPCSR
jgi:Tfp pilus assembly protein PilF